MITFPELRALMAKHGDDQASMGNLIGNTYQTFGRKLRCDSEFTFDDMITIRDHYNSKGEEVSMDKLFFNWRNTKK